MNPDADKKFLVKAPTLLESTIWTFRHGIPMIVGGTFQYFITDGVISVICTLAWNAVNVIGTFPVKLPTVQFWDVWLLLFVADCLFRTLRP